MSNIEAIVLECPQCGTVLQKNSRICPNCYSEYVVTAISTLDNLDKSKVNKYINAYKKGISQNGESSEGYFSMGICYLKLGLYEYAINNFEKSIGLLPEDSDVYYYTAIALFKGKRPFLALLSNIKRSMEYLDVALSMSEEGKYYYLQYVIQKDFYDRKRLKSRYLSSELLNQAKYLGIADEDIELINKYIPVRD